MSDPVEGRLDETVQIYCSVYAQNGSTITWNFGTDQIPMSEAKYTITETSEGDLERTSFLSVSSLVRNDNGKYQCKVQNQGGSSDTQDAQIIVIGKYRPKAARQQINKTKLKNRII